MKNLSGWLILTLSSIFVFLAVLLIISPIKTSAQTTPGAQCIYSQGTTCYIGNCLDGSQNCGFNVNCGYVVGASSGTQTSCPGSSGGGSNGGGNSNGGGQVNNPAPTPIPTCPYTEDCDAGDGLGSGTHTCTGFNSGNACTYDSRVPTNCSVCKPKDSVTLNTTDLNGPFDPNTVSLGQPVDVTITTSRSCSSNPKLDPGAGLFGTETDGTCSVSKPMSCDTGSSDWRKKCSMTFSCQAAHQVGNYSATFTAAVNSNCTVNYPYTINPPKQCRVSTPNASPTGDKGTVKDDNMSANQQIAALEGNGLLPSDFNQNVVNNANTLDSQTSNPGNQISVAEGFLGLLQTVACNIHLVEFITGNLCPEKLDLAKGHTNLIHDQSQTLALAKRPADLQLTPAQGDCVLTDSPTFNGSQTYTGGNKKVDDVNTSFQTDYGQNLPPLDSTGPSPDPNQNLNLAGVPFNQDKRDPQVMKLCNSYQQSLFPPDITICQKP